MDRGIKASILMVLAFVFVADNFAQNIETEAPASLISTVTEDLASFKAERPDFTSDNESFVAEIDREILALRNQYGDSVVDLEDESVRALAPQVSLFVVGGVETVVRLAGINKPGVSLSLRRDAAQYNAAAQNATQTITKTVKTYLVDGTGKKTLVGEDVEVEKNKISSIIVGAELVRLFIWKKERVALFAAILGHEVGHILFDHSTEAVSNEHEADIFAAKILKNGTDLIMALDMLALAAHTYNSLKSMIRSTVLYNLIRAAVNRVVLDVKDLGELGLATTHAYVATVIYNALKQVENNLSKEISRSNEDEACFVMYEALKRSCVAPSAVFGGHSDEEIKALCRQREHESYLKGIKNTHPTPFDRRALIEVFSRR